MPERFKVVYHARRYTRRYTSARLYFTLTGRQQQTTQMTTDNISISEFNDRSAASPLAP